MIKPHTIDILDWLLAKKAIGAETMSMSVSEQLLDVHTSYPNFNDFVGKYPWIVINSINDYHQYTTIIQLMNESFSNRTDYSIASDVCNRVGNFSNISPIPKHIYYLLDERLKVFLYFMGCLDVYHSSICFESHIELIESISDTIPSILINSNNNRVLSVITILDMASQCPINIQQIFVNAFDSLINIAGLSDLLSLTTSLLDHPVLSLSTTKGYIKNLKILSNNYQ